MAPNSSSATVRAEVATHIRETGILNEDEPFPDDVVKENNHQPSAPRKEKIEFKPKIVWSNTIALGIFHLLALYGLYLAFQARLATLAFTFMIFAFGGLGISAGAHRYFAHRSFKAKLPLHLFLLFCQTVANQSSAYIWARDHRMHHKYSETDADPYNSTRGVFFAHIGWLMQKKHPAVIEKSKQFKHEDLLNDPWVYYQHKYYLLFAIPLGVLVPTLVPWYFWGESLKISFFVGYVLRTMITANIVWSVNSVAHRVGFRPYNKDIRPADNWLVSSFTAGEGWHNYHHSFPYDWRGSEIGIGTNWTANFINLMARWGLAYDLRAPTDEMVKARAAKTGDGSRPYNFPDEFGNYPAASEKQH